MQAGSLAPHAIPCRANWTSKSRYLENMLAVLEGRVPLAGFFYRITDRR